MKPLTERVGSVSFFIIRCSISRMMLLSLILITFFVSPALSEITAQFKDITSDSGIIFHACSFILTSKSSPGRCKGDSVDKCSCLKLKERLLVDCSNRNMTRIPNKIPKRTTVLLLNHNDIKEVPNNVFENNSNLMHLDLSYNNISVIMNNSFDQLHQLQTLLLQNNHLRYTKKSFPSSGFQHLEKLSCLRIEQKGLISDVEDYPIQSLMPLKNLQVLFMDGLPNRTLSQIFSFLTNLVTFVLNGITGRCNLTSVTNGSFVFLSHIENLALLNCSLTSIEKGSFEEMKNLLSLNISYNTELHFQSMVNVTYGLTKLSHFRSLNFTKIHSTFGRCTYLDSQMLQYFNQTTMQELILDSNRLSTVDADALDFLPKNLTYLSVANNKIDIDSYLINLLCKFDDILPNLKTFIISRQNSKMAIGELLLQEWSLPFIESHKANWNLDWFAKPSSKVISQKECVSHILKKCTGCPLIHTGPCPWRSLGEFCMYPLPLLLPPYLENIDFTGSDYRISLEEVCLCRNNTLTNLNMKRNLVYSFPGPFYGFENLKTLDLAENYCNNITEASFKNMSNLRTLNLSSNYLGDCINGKTSMLPFKNQQKLTHLDLSNNKLRTLPREIFFNLTSLEYLSLAENRLSTVNVSIGKLKKIKVLDLSNNLLETIPADVRIVLDYARNHNNATVNMAQNAFKCICKYQSFIEWIRQNRIMFVAFDDYYCHFEKDDRRYLLKDSTVINRLQKECTNYTPLILGTSLSIGLVIFILVFVISYRYRWHIRYMYYSAKFRYNGYGRVDDDDDCFIYDIFVSHADADKHFVLEQMVPELEGKRQLRLLVHERDFPFGKLVTENIHQAISSSRRTMLVVSPNFLSSKWCRYEMNIAKVEGINRDREVLCVVMKDSIPISKLPIELMDIIAKSTYLNVPTDPELFTGFWDSIEALIH